MSGDKNPKKKKRRLAGLALSIIPLAALTYIAIMLISGRDLGLTRFLGLFSSGETVEWAYEYNFDVGRGRVFADLDSAVASAGTLGIQVIDYGGDETFRDSFRMTDPAINAFGERAVAFDIGGKAVRVFDANGITAAFDAEGAVVAATINENGWFCVCAQDIEGFKGAVTVFNNAGKDVYKVKIASGYVLSAVLSPDNRRLAILVLTDNGSRIIYYSLNSEDVGNTFDMPGGLILEIRYSPGGDMLAITTDSLIAVDKDGAQKELYDFSGRRLGGYSLDGALIALHLLDYGVGYGGRLVTFGNDGEYLGMIATYRDIISMSSENRTLAVLRSDGLFFYDAELNEIPQTGHFESTAGINRVLSLGGGAVLIAGDHSAVVISDGS
ncbi:MAG: DUF5711 family protein [Oscillospiraceae bacterium]|jgi:hypothetical protein|nr:DUF5711 family protein [Oscillospiraceae bacterium]